MKKKLPTHRGKATTSDVEQWTEAIASQKGIMSTVMDL
jgi:hypothetical protein